uniref:Uncharacterized protein n=1 Tax=Tenacibaculum sp. Pbs-1 TaxID=3238748 RepID=A0AB33KWF0_9FLAO
MLILINKTDYIRNLALMRGFLYFLITKNITQLFTVNLTNHKVSTATFNKPLSNIKSGRKKQFFYLC